MKRLALLVWLAVAAPAAAQVPGFVPPADPRLRTVAYDPGRVVALRVAQGFQLTVIFSPEERVENVAIGDSDAWQVTLNGRGDALFVKPLQDNAATNMTVITDVRVYSFELSPASAPTPDSPFTVRFLYPEDSATDAAAPPPDYRRYRLSGARAVRPVSVTDDGSRTTIEWAERQYLPAVFAIDERGAELLLDGYMRDGRYVIDSIHPALIFRLDHRTARADRQRPERAR